MATLDIPQRYLALAPVIVTSPAPRCGTTLLQRLLSTAENGFVYGEEIGLQIRNFTAWFVEVLQQSEKTGEAADADFRRALDGSLTDWRPALLAPAAVMRRAYVESFYGFPATIADYSRSIGRPIWGFKAPSLSRDTLRVLLSMMPKAKVVYVFRNLFDVLKSAKARRFVTTEEEVAKFCADWNRNLREVSELAHDERVLFLKYEDLLDRKAEHLKLLELFTGAAALDPSAFDLKINTFAGKEADGHSPTQYIEPAELTDADRASVVAEAGPVMAHFYKDQLASA